MNGNETISLSNSCKCTLTNCIVVHFFRSIYLECFSSEFEWKFEVGDGGISDEIDRRQDENRISLFFLLDIRMKFLLFYEEIIL